MEGIVDIDAWRQVLVSSLTELGTRVAAFLPSLVAALVILGLGLLLARFVRAVASRTLRRFGLDRAGQSLQVTQALRQAGVKSEPSALLAQVLFWIVVLAFTLAAAETLGLSGVATTINRLIVFLPDLIAASLILVVGALLGRLARNLVDSGARVARLSQAPRLGAAAQALVLLVAFVLALEQLGVETRLLVLVITALVATLGLTAGAAFAMGSRPLSGHILAGHFLRQTLPTEGTVSVQGRRGAVERVGAVDTILTDGETSWSVPNAVLIEETVER